jgi:hypothetical protein
VFSEIETKIGIRLSYIVFEFLIVIL